MHAARPYIIQPPVAGPLLNLFLNDATRPPLCLFAAMPMKPDYGSPLWGSPKAFRKRVLLWKIAGGVLLAAVAVGVIHLSLIHI